MISDPMQCDQGGEDGSAKECQGVLVVPSGYPTPMLETVRAALGGVAVPIDFRAGRPSAVRALACVVRSGRNVREACEESSSRVGIDGSKDASSLVRQRPDPA